MNTNYDTTQSIYTQQKVFPDNTDNNFFIQEDSPDHHFRTEIPNIVFLMGLTSDQIYIYMNLKRIAGDKGACWKSIKELSKDCNMSENTFRRGIQELVCSRQNIGDLMVNPFELITITPRKKDDGSQTTNLIQITPIWRLNGDYFNFKNKRGGSNPGGGVVQTREGGGSNLGPKQEQVNKEQIQQQQSKTTSREAPLFAAVVFEKSTQEKEQQQKCNAQPVAVVDCLKEVKIPECDKIWLSQHYPEPVIANAVAWATHPSTKINQRLQQALKWACRANPEVPKDEVAYLNENQGYAVEMEKYQSPHSMITALNRCVEFAHKSSQSAPTCIDYDDKKFKEKVKDALMKYGFTKTQQQTGN